MEPGLELCKRLALSSCWLGGLERHRWPRGVDSGQNHELEGLSRGLVSAGSVLEFCMLFINRKWGGSPYSWAQGRAGVREPRHRTGDAAAHCRTPVVLGGHTGGVFLVTPSTRLGNFLQSQPLKRKNNN